MTNTAPISGLTPDVAPVQPAQAAASGGTSSAPGASQPSQSAPSAAADLRLVIEDDKAAGSYVYITVDPVTGQVVSQIPREQLLKMRESPDYQPGAVFSART